MLYDRDTLSLADIELALHFKELRHKVSVGSGNQAESLFVISLDTIKKIVLSSKKKKKKT